MTATAAIESLMEPAATQHLAQLAAQVPEHQAIVEIGTHHAANLTNMAAAAKNGLGATCYGIDAYGQGDIYRGRPHMLDRYTHADHDIAVDNIRSQHLIRRAKIIVATSGQAAAEWAGPKIGLLVIDGEHRRDAVLNDYNSWRPHLADNATIAFDDYGGTVGAEVKAVVDELLDTGELHWVHLAGTRLATTTPRPH